MSGVIAQPTPSWPASLSKYRALGVLGRGAAGVVWHAEDVRTGTPVALKILDESSEEERDGFQREILAHARLDTPGVVRVLDYGDSDGKLWYAMEFLSGEPFDRFIRDPERREEALRCIRDLCVTLGRIHAQGVIHRDLKPSNVVLGPSRTAVLIDLGLHSHSSRRGAGDVLEAGGRFSGTPGYAAPEQFRGQFVDARCDLYAVGCMLFEVLWRRPVFEGEDFLVVSRHLSDRPEIPITPGTASEPLRRLVAGLLAKDPRGRPGYAADVADELTRALGADDDPPAAATPVYFYRAGFVGRGEALDSLRSILEDVQEGRGRGVWIAGESGIGKTRLLMEFTRFVPHGMLLVTSECIAAEGREVARGQTPPMEPWKPLLARIVAHAASCPDSGLHRVLHEHAGILAQYTPLPAAMTGSRTLPSVENARERLVGAFVAIVEAYAAEQPVTVVIDDLQWADELTLACLSHLLQLSIHGIPLLLVATFRTEEVGDTLRSLLRESEGHRIDLDPLHREGVASMMADMLALERPSPRLLDFVASQAEGNPFFLSEYLYEAAEAGVLARKAGVGWSIREDAVSRIGDSVATPLTIRDLVGRRLARLDEAPMRYLRAAAVLGRAFESEDVRTVAGIDRDEAGVMELELTRRNVLEPTGRGAFRFVHDKLREVAYQRIEAGLVPDLHGRAGVALRDRLSGEVGADTRHGELAHHFSMAGSLAEALKYAGSAGEAASRSGAFEEARRLLESAVAHNDRLGGHVDTTTLARWHRMMGGASFALGDLETCIAETERSIRSLGRRVPASEAGWSLLAAREVARLMFSREAAASDAFQESLEEAFAATQLAVSFYYDARLIPAGAAVLLGLNAARRADDRGRLADSWSRLAFICGAMGWRTGAERYFERARRAGAAAGEPGSLGLALYMEAQYRLGTAEWEAAAALASRSEKLFAEIDNQQEREVALTIGGHSLYYRGGIDEAFLAYQEILHSARRRLNRQHMGWGHFLSGRSRIAAGEWEEGFEQLERGHSLLSGLPDSASLAMCEGTLAWAAVLTDRRQRAHELTASNLARFRAGRRPLVGQCLDAYQYVAETALALAERGGSPSTDRMAVEAIGELARFARVFPIGVPSIHRCRAKLGRLQGRPGAARQLAEQAVTAAEGLGMLHEKRLALEELERTNR